MEATRSSKTSVLVRPTWRHVREDGVLLLSFVSLFGILILFPIQYSSLRICLYLFLKHDDSIVLSYLFTYLSVHSDCFPVESLGLFTLSVVQNSKLLENTTFWKLDLFPKPRMMDEVQKPFDSECFTPLS
jgi:hypothetical protein